MEVNPYLTEPERARLSTVRIGIAGAGGLGSNAAMHLIRAGVKRLRIVDFDTVAASNLNRQFFFADQLGEKKVAALQANLLRINPDAEIDARDLRISAETLPGLFDGCDLVVEALDDAKTKTLVIRYFLARREPLVAASGLAGWGRSNEMRVRQAGSCLYLIGDGVSGVDPAGHLAPASPRVGIAAAMEANTAIAILLGLPV